MYSVLWSKTALEQVEKLEKPLARQISDKLESIRKSPLQFVKKLKDTPFHRLRVGKYRVIMKIENKKMVIFVIEVGHRKNIYR